MSKQNLLGNDEACSDFSHLRNELDMLDADIVKHHSRLELESVWLFLATLGCWGVTIPLVQLIAYIITFTLFGTRIKQVSGEYKGSFPTRLKIIKSNIDTVNDKEDRKKALLWDCHNLNKRISVIKSPFTVPTYIVVFLFFIISLFLCLIKLMYGDKMFHKL